jgi:4-aminobutyrate aminotransferase-like enzyme
MGLMQALELVQDRRTKEPHPQGVLQVLEETKRRGVLLGKGGLYGNVLRIGMPLIAEPAHVDELIAALDAGLAAVASAS